MTLREKLKISTRDAMKNREAARLSTLRLIGAAIKDRDIEARAEGQDDGVSDAEIMAVLAKMVKQRQESARAYEGAGRVELAEQERGEIDVIEEFLPRALDAEEQDAAIQEAIAQSGAEGLRDMGKVMAHLKARYMGQMDFGAVGPKVKERLAKG